MGLFNQFPFTNFHEMNLDWVIGKIKETDNKISIETTERKDADAELNRKIESLPSYMSNKNIIIVSKTGGQFNTVTSAVDFAKQYATASNRVCIVICEGEYVEDIDLAPNPGIDLIGLNAVITSSGTGYPRTALYTAGKGYFYGIQFNGTVTYGVHVEVQGLNNIIPGDTIFDHCGFYSAGNSCIGAGIGKGTNLFLRDCVTTPANEKYGIYIHNFPGNDEACSAIVERCKNINGNGFIWLDDAAKMANSSYAAPLYMYFIDNTAYTSSPMIMRYRNNTVGEYHGIQKGDNIRIAISHGNNAESLNYYEGQILKGIGGAYKYNNAYRITIPCQLNFDTCAINPTTITISGVGNATNSPAPGYAADSFSLFGANVENPDSAPQAIDAIVEYTITFAK